MKHPRVPAAVQFAKIWRKAQDLSSLRRIVTVAFFLGDLCRPEKSLSSLIPDYLCLTAVREKKFNPSRVSSSKEEACFALLQPSHGDNTSLTTLSA